MTNITNLSGVGTKKVYDLLRRMYKSKDFHNVVLVHLGTTFPRISYRKNKKNYLIYFYYQDTYNLLLRGNVIDKGKVDKLNITRLRRF